MTTYTRRLNDADQAFKAWERACRKHEQAHKRCELLEIVTEQAWTDYGKAYEAALYASIGATPDA